MACKKARGKRAKTRQKMRRKRRFGKLTVNKRIMSFEKGQKVQVNIDPSVHSGLPHPRYHGLVGTVQGNQGKYTYRISLKLGKQPRVLLVNSAHLKLMKTAVVSAKA